MDLTNKVAIITGSAQGLGKAFAARLLEVRVFYWNSIKQKFHCATLNDQIEDS